VAPEEDERVVEPKEEELGLVVWGAWARAVPTPDLFRGPWAGTTPDGRLGLDDLGILATVVRQRQQPTTNETENRANNKQTNLPRESFYWQ
jgi:hypothetical protein